MTRWTRKRRKALRSTIRLRRPPVQRYPGGSLVPAVLETLRAGSLLGAGELVVLAVSGGPDSICMLHCLQALRATLDIRLHVAYVHHGLRAEADDDADFVREQAA